MQKRYAVLGLSVVLALAVAVPAFAGSDNGGDNATVAKKGKRGKRGKQGPPGPAGPQGPAGPAGPAGPGAGDLRVGQTVNILNPDIGPVLITENEGFAWFGVAVDSPDACAIVVVNVNGGNNSFIGNNNVDDEDFDEGDDFTVAFNTDDGAARSFEETVIYGTPQGPEGPITTQLGIGGTLNNPDDVGQGDCHVSLNILAL